MSAQEDKSVIRKGLIQVLAIIFFVVVLSYLIESDSYLLFHSVAEIFSTVILWSVFILTFNTRRFLKTSYFIFLGTGFLFVGIFDIFHTLAYKGMHIFPGSNSSNLSTQLWIAMRYMLGLSYLLAPFFLRRKINFRFVFAGFFTVTTVLLLTILWKPVFPTCYISDTGLTPFKIISEYVICILLFAGLWLMQKRRNEFHADVFRYLVGAIGLTIASEIFFTLYKDIFGLFNTLGHILEILAFLAAYKAVIEKGLNHPHDLIFFDMKRHEAALSESEKRYKSLFNSMTEGFALHEIICDDLGEPCDYRFIDVNPAFEKMTGLKHNAVVGRLHSEIFPSDDPHWITEYGAVALTGKSARFENYSPALNRHYEVFAYRPAPRQFAVISTDITEVKKMRDEISYLASFPILNQHPVTEADLNGTLCYANPAAQQLFPDIGKLGPKHPWMGDWAAVTRACDDPDVVFPTREIMVNGRYFHQTLSFLKLSRRVRIYGIDITTQKQIEKTLIQNETRLQAALLAGRAFIFEWNPGTDAVYRSEHCGPILGLDPAICTRDTGRNFFERIHPEDRDGFKEMVQTLTPAAPDYKTEYRYIQPNGQTVWLEERGLADFDRTGHFIRVHGITTDVTDRVEARRRESEALAAASAARSAAEIVNAMDEGVVLMKLDGTIININPAALAFAALREQDAVGRNVGDILLKLLSGQDLKMAMSALAAIAQKQPPLLHPVMLRRPQCPPLYIIPAITFIKSPQGSEAVVVTLKDITALHENTEILERVFDNSHISIVYLDSKFNFIRVNSTYAADCGHPEDFYPGKNHFDIYPHEENERIFRQVVASGNPYTVHDKPFEFPDHPEWGVSYWDWSLQPIKDEQGQVEALIFCLQNTTARKTAQLALEENERKYRELVENANSIIMRITSDHRITFFNEYAQTFFGYSAKEIIGRSVLGTIVPAVDSYGKDLGEMLEAVTASPEFFASNENENICKNGRRVWISWTNKVVRDENGKITEILCVGKDATERKRIQDENLRYQERLRGLAEQLAASEEVERWQISRYIHDTVVQNLSLSSIKLGGIQSSLAKAGLDEKALVLQSTRALIDDAIDECRNAMSELTPPLLYELGLAPALIDLAERLKERHGIPITVEKSGELDSLEHALRGLLFQSTRELVINALKHADCSRICIFAGAIENAVQISVQDDGKGFNPLNLNHHKNDRGGFGLFSVRERAEMLGGRIEIQSAPGCGTKVKISVPIPDNESRHDSSNREPPARISR